MRGNESATTNGCAFEFVFLEVVGNFSLVAKTTRKRIGNFTDGGRGLVRLGCFFDRVACGGNRRGRVKILGCFFDGGFFGGILSSFFNCRCFFRGRCFLM